MDHRARHDAEALRAQLGRGPVARDAFRAALLEVPKVDRDAWVDELFGLEEHSFEDGPALPRGGVPYLACPVDTVLRAVDAAAMGPDDVVVDVGAGVGRAALLVHLLSGAAVVGLEVQPALVQAARERAARVPSARVSFLEGDAAELLGQMANASVFFFYCPFSGERAERARAGLEALSRARELRVCCVDWPMPECSWLERTAEDGDLVVFRSRVPSP